MHIKRGIEEKHKVHITNLIQSDRPMMKLDKKNDCRIIKGGRILRKTCIDELPQLFNVLNMSSLKRSIFKIGLFSNKFIVVSLIASVVLLAMVLYVPFFQGVFQFASLGLLEILIIVLLSSSVLWLGELYKYLKNKSFV